MVIKRVLLSAAAVATCEPVASGLVLLGTALIPQLSAAPSPSAATSRTPLAEGKWQLLRHRGFWCLAICYGTLTGFFAAWASMLGPNMQAVLARDVAEREAGWLGFWGAMAAMGAGALVGAFAGVLRRGKGLVLMCCAGAALSFSAFGCLCAGVVRLPDESADSNPTHGSER